MSQTIEQFLDARHGFDARSGQLQGFSYKLTQGQYGLDVALPEFSADSIDEGRMSAWIVFADGTNRDGVGDKLEVGGIRTERHQKNPIVLFDHGQKVQLPVALAEDPETHEYTVVLDPVNQVAKGNAFFYQGKGLSGVDRTEEYDHAVFCEQLFHMIAKRFVRAGSFGYQVLRGEQIPADYRAGIPQGLHLLSTLLLEFSPVVLPANADTVRKVLSDDRMCGKRLSPYLVKSLAPYAPERKAFMAVETKAFTPRGSMKVREQLWETKQNSDGKWFIVDDEGGKAAGPFPDGTAANRELDKIVASALAKASQKSYATDPLDARDDYDNPLSDATVPPAAFRPGKGAIKELRKKYGRKHFNRKAARAGSRGGWDRFYGGSGYSGSPGTSEGFRFYSRGKGTVMDPWEFYVIEPNGTSHKFRTEQEAKSAMAEMIRKREEAARRELEEFQAREESRKKRKRMKKMRSYGEEFDEAFAKQTLQQSNASAETAKRILANEGRVDRLYHAAIAGYDEVIRALPTGNRLRAEAEQNRRELQDARRSVGAKSLISKATDIPGVGHVMIHWDTGTRLLQIDTDDENRAYVGDVSGGKVRWRKNPYGYTVDPSITDHVNQWIASNAKSLLGREQKSLRNVAAKNGLYVSAFADPASLVNDYAAFASDLVNRFGGTAGALAEIARLVSSTASNDLMTRRVLDKLRLAVAKIGQMGKAMKNLRGKYKSLEMRQKYRPVKKLRRRLRKSSPGASTMWIDGKDLDALRKESSEKGLETAWVGHKNGMDKVRLSGDDAAIDAVAKKFGRTGGWKGLSGKAVKAFAPGQPVRFSRSFLGYPARTKVTFVRMLPDDPKMAEVKLSNGHLYAVIEDVLEEIPKDGKSLPNQGKKAGLVAGSRFQFDYQNWVVTEIDQRTGQLTARGDDGEELQFDVDDKGKPIAYAKSLPSEDIRMKCGGEGGTPGPCPNEGGGKPQRMMVANNRGVYEEQDRPVNASSEKLRNKYPGQRSMRDIRNSKRDGKFLPNQRSKAVLGTKPTQNEVQMRVDALRNGGMEAQDAINAAMAELGLVNLKLSPGGDVIAYEHLGGTSVKAFGGEKWELAYHVPGKGGWKRKEFKTEAERSRFIEKLVEKEGDDVEFQYRDPEGKSIAVKNGYVIRYRNGFLKQTTPDDQQKINAAWSITTDRSKAEVFRTEKDASDTMWETNINGARVEKKSFSTKAMSFRQILDNPEGRRLIENAEEYVSDLRRTPGRSEHIQGLREIAKELQRKFGFKYDINEQEQAYRAAGGKKSLPTMTEAQLVEAFKEQQKAMRLLNEGVTGAMLHVMDL